jgi:hypothetical protein
MGSGIGRALLMLLRGDKHQAWYAPSKGQPHKIWQISGSRASMHLQPSVSSSHMWGTSVLKKPIGVSASDSQTVGMANPNTTWKSWLKKTKKMSVSSPHLNESKELETPTPGTVSHWPMLSSPILGEPRSKPQGLNQLIHFSRNALVVLAYRRGGGTYCGIGQ